jgi:hypothetical protein
LVVFEVLIICETEEEDKKKKKKEEEEEETAYSSFFHHNKHLIKLSFNEKSRLLEYVIRTITSSAFLRVSRQPVNPLWQRYCR